MVKNGKHVKVNVLIYKDLDLHFIIIDLRLVITAGKIPYSILTKDFDSKTMIVLRQAIEASEELIEQLHQLLGGTLWRKSREATHVCKQDAETRCGVKFTEAWKVGQTDKHVHCDDSAVKATHVCKQDAETEQDVFV